MVREYLEFALLYCQLYKKLTKMWLKLKEISLMKVEVELKSRHKVSGLEKILEKERFEAL